MANLFEKVSFCGRSSLQRIDNKDVACSLSIALTLGVKRNDFERQTQCVCGAKALSL